MNLQDEHTDRLFSVFLKGFIIAGISGFLIGCLTAYLYIIY